MNYTYVSIFSVHYAYPLFNHNDYIRLRKPRDYVSSFSILIT